MLEERDFVRRRHSSSLADETEYAIKHALTREVAYAGIPKERRARLHVAFAEWLERRPERPQPASLRARMGVRRKRRARQRARARRGRPRYGGVRLRARPAPAPARARPRRSAVGGAPDRATAREDVHDGTRCDRRPAGRARRAARSGARRERSSALLRPGIYLEPFALRALAVVRGDDALREQAVSRFDALGLDWHADQTRIAVD